LPKTSSNSADTLKNRQDIRIHGHRGWRGLYPENTVVGFCEAIKLGVDVLEMDVVLSADQQLVVSHDPFMHHEICRKADGTEITSSEEEKHNLFRMTLREIQLCIKLVNIRIPRFPEQKQIATNKPSFQEVVDAVQPLLNDHQRKNIHWNIEIKSRPEWDQHFIQYRKSMQLQYMRI
jgi:glycerophosphoryl diester phosphodiesterase